MRANLATPEGSCPARTDGRQSCAHPSRLCRRRTSRANTASVDRAVTLRLLSPHLFGLALRRSPARGVRWPSGWAENRTADRLRFVAVLAARREGLAVEARETVVSEILSLTPCQLVHSRTPAWRVHKSTASPPR